MRRILLILIHMAVLLVASYGNEKEDVKKAEKAAKKSLEAKERKDVTGYWFMHDLNKVRSGIAYVYEYKGIIYGRTIATIDPDTKEVDSYNNPTQRAKHIEGNPFTAGLDIIWGLSWDEKKRKWVKGRILDPRKKNPYHLDLWREGNVLKVFGNIGAGIGAAVDWHRASEKNLPKNVPAPNVTKFVPKVYY